MKKQGKKAINVIQGYIQSRVELLRGMASRRDASKGSQTAEDTCIFKRRNENKKDPSAWTGVVLSGRFFRSRGAWRLGREVVTLRYHVKVRVHLVVKEK
jgi:hypothetical protein